MRERDLPTVREFERALKAIGLSRSEVRTIMHEGYIALVKRIMASKKHQPKDTTNDK